MRLLFIFLCIGFFSFSQSPYGDWYATLKTADLPLVFHIKEVGKKTVITVDSPKQEAYDMPAEIVIKTGERSMLTYLLSPLTKRLASAMKEE